MSTTIRQNCIKILSREEKVPVNFSVGEDNPDVRDVPVPKENRIVFVNVFEWAAALKKANPKTDDDREMVRDFKLGLARAGDPKKIPGWQVGVQAMQALAVLDMDPAYKPPTVEAPAVAVPAVPNSSGDAVEIVAEPTEEV